MKTRTLLTYLLVGVVITSSCVLAIGTIYRQESLLGSAAAQSVSTANNNQTIRTLSVTGISNTKVSADMLTISFAIESQEKTASQAIQVNAGNTTNVITALMQAGVNQSEISTSQYNVYPVYDYVNVTPDCIQYGTGDQIQKYCPPPVGKQILVGYKAVNGILIQSSQLDKAGQWIDSAIQAGANRVDYLYFSASSQRQSETKNTLISLAIQDAREKADAALRPLGMSVENVLSINVNTFPVIYSRTGYQYSSAAPAGGSPTTPVIPGSQDVSASVEVTFEIGGFGGGGTSLADTTISTTTNGTFNVALDSNPSTGYQWQVKTIDNSVVKLINDQYVAPMSGLVGASGKQILTFEALQTGHTTIQLQYVRPWDLQNPAKYYAIDLRVGP